MSIEKVLIVHLNREIDLSESRLNSKISEIKELVRAANSEVVRVVVQNLSKINSKYYIGSGKALEIAELCEIHDIDTVIFNNELTGSQMKNLEDIIDRKIVDRTGLILDIFATRAKTKEAKLQVKLAQLEYRLPRLVGFRNYLSREGAGIGTRGPGEQKLEIDRRTVQREINSIKTKLEGTKTIRKVKMDSRLTSHTPVVSIIGYSNAGKSTILNALCSRFGADKRLVYSDDLLFATLETSARKIKLENGKQVIFTDTVGFVSDLPTKLVESFKSTLEEIEISQLLMIVIDASNEDYEIQLTATRDILKDMEIENKKILYVFNKMDINPYFRYFEKVENDIYISAFDMESIDRLSKKVEELLFEEYSLNTALIPYSEYVNFIKFVPENLISRQEYLDEGIKTQLYLDKEQKERFKKYIKNV